MAFCHLHCSQDKLPYVVSAACICLQKISSLEIGARALLDHNVCDSVVKFPLDCHCRIWYQVIPLLSSMLSATTAGTIEWNRWFCFSKRRYFCCSDAQISYCVAVTLLSVRTTFLACCDKNAHERLSFLGVPIFPQCRRTGCVSA